MVEWCYVGVTVLVTSTNECEVYSVGCCWYSSLSNEIEMKQNLTFYIHTPTIHTIMDVSNLCACGIDFECCDGIYAIVHVCVMRGNVHYA